MTSTAPPAYKDDAPPAYSRDDKIAIQSAAAVAIQKPAVKAQLEIDLDNFTAVIKEIKNSFRVVENKLGEIDSKGLAKPYQPEWIGFRQRYEALLLESERTATTIATEIEKIDTFILPYITGKKKPDDSKESHLQEIADFIEESQGFQEKADSLNQRFSALANDIDAYKSAFVRFADELLAKTKEEVVELRADIASLKKKIGDLNSRLRLLIGSLGIVIFGSVALAIFFPAFAGAIVTGAAAIAGGLATQIIANLDERAKHEADLVGKNATLKEKVATIGAIEKAREDLKILGETEITKIVNGIQMLSEIWKTVFEDIKSVENYLKRTQRAVKEYENDPDAPVAIVSYLKSGCSIYAGLAQALFAYSKGTKAKN